MKNYFKGGDIHGSKLRMFYRHSGGYIADKIKDSGITPNMVTYLDLILFILVALLFLNGYLFYAGILLLIAMILDYVDGSLARIKNCVTPLGKWLDSTGDMFAMIIIVGAMTTRANLSINPWFLAFMTLTSFFAVKLLYLRFNQYFSFATDVIKNTKKKNTWLSSLHYNETLLFTLMILAGITGRIDIFLIFCSGYGWLFYFAMNSILTKKAYKS